jgi:hypothetical protein
MASLGNRGQSPLPPPGPTDDGGNGLGERTAYGPGGTLAPGNPDNGNPQRGGTTIPQGQAGIAPGQGRAPGSNN